MGAASAILIVLITILCVLIPHSLFAHPINLHLLVPPLGVYMVAGCGADLFVNICLTILGYLDDFWCRKLITNDCQSIPRTSTCVLPGIYIL